MKKSGFLLGSILAFICATLLSGCSRNLDRQTAAAVLKNSLAFQTPEEVYFQVGTLGGPCLYRELPRDGVYAFLEKQGYITIRPIRRDMWDVQFTEKGKLFVQKVKLETYGHHEEQGCRYDQMNLPIATYSLLQVTGIGRDGNTAKVEFTWKWKPNEIGQALTQDAHPEQYLNATQLQSIAEKIQEKGGVSPLGKKLRTRFVPVPAWMAFDQPGSARLRLYDDGWRIEE